MGQLTLLASAWSAACLGKKHRMVGTLTNPECRTFEFVHAELNILLCGLKGEPVWRLQEKLSVEADGVFGAGAEKAVCTENLHPDVVVITTAKDGVRTDGFGAMNGGGRPAHPYQMTEA